MFTTGFKYFFGLAVGLLTAAVLYGYTSGGNHMGPLSLGWKGGVGEHVGYGILVLAGTTALVMACTIIYMRDADPEAQASYAGVENLAPTLPVTPSHWPVVAAFAVGTMAIGLVLHTAVFIAGLAALGLVALEWTMDTWSDQATGDPEANRTLRNRVMAPIEIPAFGAAAVAVIVLSISRIFLNASEHGAVLIAGIVAVVILALGTAASLGRGINRNIVTGIALVAAVAVLAGGIWAAVDGERNFEHHDTGDHGAQVEHAGAADGAVLASNPGEADL